jgi:hypothetical protein
LTIYDRVYDMMAEQQDDDGGVEGSSNDREARDIRDGALHLRHLLIKSASSSRQEQQDGPDEENFFGRLISTLYPPMKRRDILTPHPTFGTTILLVNWKSHS